jgi:hypothetical protein
MVFGKIITTIMDSRESYLKNFLEKIARRSNKNGPAPSTGQGLSPGK